MALLSLTLSALFLATRTHAGQNAGGSAYLSWNVAGDSIVTPVLPISPTPVYVHLINTHEIRQLAIALTIEPADSENACYRLAAPPESAGATSSCGLASPASEYLSFGSDNTFDWAIVFNPNDFSRNLVAYYIAANGCLTPASGTCSLTSVIAVDSSGIADTLEITGGVTIEPPPLVTGVTPDHVVAGENSTLLVSGVHYTPGAQVTLASGATTITATTVAEDSSQVTVQVAPQAQQAGVYDVVVTFPDSSSTVAPGALSIETEATASNPVYRPTDDGNAFTRINIHNHTAQWYPYEDGTVTSYGYPDSMSGHVIGVTGSAPDPIALIDSYSANGLILRETIYGLSFVRYSANSRAASSIGLFAMTPNSFKGGQNDDTNRSILKITTVHANGDSVVNRLRVGRNVRNTPDYSDFCGTYYVTPPDDSLWHQVRTGPLFESNTWYFDEQEVRIPKEQRGSPISYVELRCDSTIAPGTSCPGQRETILFGMSLWNRFRVANSSGDAMPLTLQTGNSAPYGGYYDGTTLVGDDRTISALGCLLTSICMVHGFYGIDVTPDSLNRYLQQRHYGYGTAKAALATITSIGANDTVYFDWHGSFDSHGPKFLIEHGQFNPVATIRIVGSLNKTAKTGRGVIDGGPYHGRTVAVGDKGRVYDRVDTRAAGLGYAITRGHRWGVYSLYDGATPLPRQAEAHMAVDIPVLLHTRLDSANNGRHWVVGIGREPAFTSPTTAKGTYAVRDPGWGASRLSDSPHVNKFSEARACSLLEVPGNPAQYPPDADPDTTGLEILLSGPATFEVRDQLGRTVSYDATSNMYISHIPSADAWRSFSVDDIDDTNDTSDLAEAAVDVVRIPLALDGAYLVTVAGKDAGDYQLSASAIGVPGTAASSDWFGTVSAGSTATYRVIYSRGAGTVTVATTAVDESNAARVMFGLEDISPNPTPGGTRIAFALRRSDAVDLTVFDLSGRRVRRLASGIMTAGPHTVSWDGRDENGQQARAGVYFVRLASGNDRSAKRMVVLP